MNITRKERQIREHCKAHSIAIHPLTGRACRLIGRGVDLIVHDICAVTPSDLDSVDRQHGHAPRLRTWPTLEMKAMG